MPWLEWHPKLLSNYAVAKKRLPETLSKLNAMNLFKEYKSFREWEKSGIIERVFKDASSQNAHYLPHRPVIKENPSTNKIRPVFDASAKQGQSPS